MFVCFKSANYNCWHRSQMPAWSNMWAQNVMFSAPVGRLCWIVAGIPSYLCSFVLLSTAFLPSAQPTVDKVNLHWPLSCFLPVKGWWNKASQLIPNLANPSISVVVLNTWTEWSRNVNMFYTQKAVLQNSVIWTALTSLFFFFFYLNKDSSLAFFHLLPFKDSMEAGIHF